MVRTLLVGLFAFVGGQSSAGDTSCYGYNSESNPFLCYSHGNCVWWATYKRPDLKAFMVHDAGLWYQDAIDAGFPVGQTARAGAVAVFSSPGHVNYVESTGSDGAFSVTEMDYYGSLGTGNGVQTATYYRVGSSNIYHRENGGQNWTLLGFIYPRYCTFLDSSTGALCWAGTNGYFSECEDGNSFTLHKRQDSGAFTTTNLSNSAGLNYCTQMTTGAFPNSYSVDLGAYKKGNATYAAYGGWSSGSGVPNAFNLKVNSFTATNSDGSILVGGQDLVKSGQVITVKAQVKAVNGNTNNNMKLGKNTIELDLYARTDSNDWVFQKRAYIQAVNLPSGATHTETLTYVVPSGVSEVSFKFKVDADDEAYEANEGDNWSGVKSFQVDFSWLIPIINLLLND